MIKKSTLIFLLCAVILGGLSYYLEFKKSKGAKPAESSKLAYSVREPDIASLALTYPGTPEKPAIRLDKSNNRWQMVQPMAAPADQAAVQTILDSLTTTNAAETTEPASADRLKAYGLAPARSEVEFRLQSGAQHTLQIGNKDFTGGLVYAIVDSAQTVSLLPASLLSITDTSLDQLRDHIVLPLSSEQVASFTLKNPSGQMALAKSKDQWRFTKPSDVMADQNSISALLTAISNARLTAFVSQKPEDLGKDGLANPAIDFTFVNDIQKKSTLLLGKKDGSGYFAKDTSRPAIFSVSADLYAQLAKSYNDLRDKKVLDFDPSDITQVAIHNDHGLIVVSSKSGDTWAIDSPSDQKGKNVLPSKIFNSLIGLHADQIIDHPSPSLAAKVAKPAIEVVLTDKIGKKMTLKVSKPAEDVVYASAGDSPALYTLKKQDFDSLNFAASSLPE